MPKTTLILAALAALSLAACQRDLDTSSATSPFKLAAAGTAGNLLGTAPAPSTTMHATNATDGSQPLTETPGTTSVSDLENELSKRDESKGMPLAGQANDHSNVSPDASQKAGQVDPKRKGTP